MTEWSIRDVAHATGLTSRALRHYESIGILRPSRVAETGYRFYGEAEVARLHRILSLRAFGMPLAEIARTLEGASSLGASMRQHLDALEATRAQLDSRIDAVREALHRLDGGEKMTIDDMFAGFDHAAHENEVRERWGDEAWERSDSRRKRMSDAERAEDDHRTADVNGDLRRAAEAGVMPESAEFDALIAAHHRWLTDQWGRVPEPDAYAGLAEMYASDERFAAVYGGAETAAVVRDAIHHWIDTRLR